MPVLPDAQPDPGRSADVAAAVESLAGSNDWTHSGITPTDAQVYTSDAATDDVVEFYTRAMEANGWESVRHRPGTNWGFERWSQGGSHNQMLVGFNNGQTVIILGCVAASPPAESSTAAGTGCLAEIQAYTGAVSDPQKTSDLDEVIATLGFTPDMLGAQAVVYLTPDSRQQVVTFYGGAMASAGWDQVLALSGDDSDFIAWEKADTTAQLLVGEDEGERVIVLGCGN